MILKNQFENQIKIPNVKHIAFFTILMILSCDKAVIDNSSNEIALFEDNAMVFLTELTDILVENGYSTEICLCDTNANQIVDPREIPHQTWEFNDDEQQYMLTGLQLVNLRSYMDSTLPASISDVPQLKQISVNGCGLNRLPDSIVYLDQLELLDIYDNEIQTMPDSLILLQQLEILNLGKNNLSSFPTSIELLPLLSHLNLNDNLIESLPESVCDILEDVQLSLYQNSLCFDSDFPECAAGKVMYQTNCYSETELTILDTLISINSISQSNCNCDMNGNGEIENFEIGEQNWQQNNNEAKLLSFSAPGLGLSNISENSLSNFNELTELNLSSNMIDSLPDDLTSLFKLEILNLSDNHLTILPENLSNMSNLYQLDVSDNDSLFMLPPLPPLEYINIGFTNLFCDSGFYNENLMEELMSSIDEIDGAYFQYCRMQQGIDFLEDFKTVNSLSANSWQNIGEQIWSEGLLTEFRISDILQVDSIPLSIAGLSELMELTLANNSLSYIDDTLSVLSNLMHLDIHGNKLTEFEVDLSEMNSLLFIDMSSNELRSIPENICQLGIAEILLQNNRICSCDDDIVSACPIFNLDEMMLDQRCPDCNEVQFLQDLVELNSIEAEIFGLGLQVWRNIDSLDGERLIQFEFNYSVLNEDKVYEIPESISNLTHLDTLIMNYHNFPETVDRIFSLPNLSYLELRADSILSISAMDSLEALQHLDLSQNEISDISSGIASLTSLNSLLLSDNQIEHLPDTLFAMTQMTILDLSDNDLTVIPPEINQMHNLHTLLLEGNLLDSLPDEICDLAIDWDNSAVFSVEDNQLCDTLFIPPCITVEPFTQNDCD